MATFCVDVFCAADQVQQHRLPQYVVVQPICRQASPAIYLHPRLDYLIHASPTSDTKCSKLNPVDLRMDCWLMPRVIGLMNLDVLTSVMCWCIIVLLEDEQFSCL